jgi:hypothetical protein
MLVMIVGTKVGTIGVERILRHRTWCFGHSAQRPYPPRHAVLRQLRFASGAYGARSIMRNEVHTHPGLLTANAHLLSVGLWSVVIGPGVLLMMGILHGIPR